MTVYANELDFIHAQLSQDRQTTGSLELLYEYRNACEQKQEQIDSAKDVIKSLTADLAKARGRCEVCGWRWHWDFDYEQGTGEGDE